MSKSLTIGELSEAARLSRRAVRFYVQQGLLDPPRGAGRASHYDLSHLQRLAEIARLQSAGHSLDAIRRILDGQPVPSPPAPVRRVLRPRLEASLWARLPLGDGVELHFDSGRYHPDVDGLLALRELAARVFGAPENGKENP